MRYQFRGDQGATVPQDGDEVTINKTGQLRFLRRKKPLLICNWDTNEAFPAYETYLADRNVIEAIAFAAFVSLLTDKPLCYIGEDPGPIYRFRIAEKDPDCRTKVHFQFKENGRHIVLRTGDQFTFDPDKGTVSFMRHGIRWTIHDIDKLEKDTLCELRAKPLERPHVEALAGVFSLLSNIPVHLVSRPDRTYLYVFGTAHS